MSLKKTFAFFGCQVTIFYYNSPEKSCKGNCWFRIFLRLQIEGNEEMRQMRLEEFHKMSENEDKKGSKGNQKTHFNQSTAQDDQREKKKRKTPSKFILILFLLLCLQFYYNVLKLFKTLCQLLFLRVFFFRWLGIFLIIIGLNWCLPRICIECSQPKRI